MAYHVIIYHKGVPKRIADFDNYALARAFAVRHLPKKPDNPRPFRDENGRENFTCGKYWLSTIIDRSQPKDESSKTLWLAVMNNISLPIITGAGLISKIPSKTELHSQFHNPT